MNTLTAEKCAPCESGVGKLQGDAITALLDSTPQWALRGDGAAIIKKLKFKNFVAALAYVNQLADLAEAEGHHPDIAFGWGYAEITLQTHSVGGLTRNDFILAAKINELA